MSRYADGRPAPFHTLEGMPEEVIIRRSPGGKIAEAKRSLVSSFVKVGMTSMKQRCLYYVTLNHPDQ